MRKMVVLAVLLSLTAATVHAFEDAESLRALGRARGELDQLVLRSCDDGLADKAEDAAAKLDDAARELAKRPPDEDAAAGVIVGAVADLEAMAAGHCFDAPIGIALMDDLTSVSRSLAARRIGEALRFGGKRGEVREAREHLRRGDALRAAGRRGNLEAFERAAGEYKDAVSKARSARP